MQYKEIVISSGGSRGIIALGAAWQLHKNGYFDHATVFSGASIGSVIAAALVLRRDLRRVLETVIKNPLESDVDPSNFGMDSGKGMITLFRKVLGLRRRTTLRDVYRTTGKTLRICVCNLTARRPEYWTHETHPKMDLVRALRVSCSVPIVFSAVTIKDKSTGDAAVYVDGAVVGSLPVASCEQYLAIGFQNAPRPVHTLEDFVDSLRAIIEFGPKPKAGRFVDLDPGNVDPFQFAMPPAEMRRAFASGIRQAVEWVKKNV